VAFLVVYIVVPRSGDFRRDLYREIDLNLNTMCDTQQCTYMLAARNFTAAAQSREGVFACIHADRTHVIRILYIIIIIIVLVTVRGIYLLRRNGPEILLGFCKIVIGKNIYSNERYITASLFRRKIIYCIYNPYLNSALLQMEMERRNLTLRFSSKKNTFMCSCLFG